MKHHMCKYADHQIWIRFHLDFLMRDSFTCITMIALLCTIVYFILCAHKHNPGKIVIKDSQRKKGQSRTNRSQKILQIYRYQDYKTNFKWKQISYIPCD